MAKAEDSVDDRRRHKCTGVPTTNMTWRKGLIVVLLFIVTCIAISVQGSPTGDNDNESTEKVTGESQIEKPTDASDQKTDKDDSGEEKDGVKKDTKKQDDKKTTGKDENDKKGNEKDTKNDDKKKEANSKDGVNGDSKDDDKTKENKDVEKESGKGLVKGIQRHDNADNNDNNDNEDNDDDDENDKKKRHNWFLSDSTVLVRVDDNEDLQGKEVVLRSDDGGRWVLEKGSTKLIVPENLFGVAHAKVFRRLQDESITEPFQKFKKVLVPVDSASLEELLNKSKTSNGTKTQQQSGDTKHLKKEIEQLLNNLFDDDVYAYILDTINNNVCIEENEGHTKITHTHHIEKRQVQTDTRALDDDSRDLYGFRKPTGKDTLEFITSDGAKKCGRGNRFTNNYLSNYDVNSKGYLKENVANKIKTDDIVDVKVQLYVEGRLFD